MSSTQHNHRPSVASGKEGRAVHCGISGFMNQLALGLRDAGRERTSETYRATINSFMHFRQGKDMPLTAITPELMERYQGWLHRRGLVPNTVSFYMRVLRAAYNVAVERGLTTDRRPFRRVYTGVAHTVKRALPLRQLRRIKELDLRRWREMEYARDIFMLSFYLRGMSFVDMAYLRKSDLRDGYITYRRRKTGQLLMIKWTGEMQRILDRYGDCPGTYLLPILPTTASNLRNAYRNMAYNINRNLKRVGRLADIGTPLTLYVARHSWASVANSKGVPIGVISRGMGHDSESTTRIYLASLDCSLVDRANARVIAAL